VREIKIIHFATYPVRQPLHGGQLRVAAIQKMLTNSGHEIIHMATYPYFIDSGGTSNEWDFIIPPDYFEWAQKHDLRPTDVDCSEFFLKSKVIYDKLVSQIQRTKPDVLVIEQAWLWPVIKKIRDENSNLRNLPLVCSSHNIESQLLKMVLEIDGVAHNKIETIYFRAFHLERDLILHSDVIIAVTEEDANLFKQIKNQQVYICPNGIAQSAPIKDFATWKSRYNNINFAFFIGSFYPPNSEGFMTMVGPHSAYLAPDMKVVVGGGVSNLITYHKDYLRYKGLIDRSFDLLGILEAGHLSSLLTLAKAILLPITHGGGSNLKTAEAILTEKPIVATSKAFRGYEKYLALPQIFIEDDPYCFKMKVQELLDSKKTITLSQEERALIQNVLWENTLSELPHIIERLAKE